MIYAPISRTCPLNEYQISLIEKPIDNTLFKVCAYIKDHPAKALSTPFTVTHNIGGGLAAVTDIAMMASASSVGGTSFMVVGAVFDCFTNCQTAGPLFVAGAAIALVAYEGLVMAENIDAIKNSREYAIWESRRNRMLQEGIIKDFVKNDSILKYLTCPITGEIPKDPVKIPYYPEITFEYEKAKEWIQNNPNTPLPGTAVVSVINDLKFDYAQINSVIERGDFLFQLLEQERITRICSFAYSFLGVKRSNVQNAAKLDGFIALCNLCEDFGYKTFRDFKYSDPLAKRLNRIKALSLSVGDQTTEFKRLRWKNVRLDFHKKFDGSLLDRSDIENNQEVKVFCEARGIRKIVKQEVRTNFLGKVKNFFRIPKEILIQLEEEDNYKEELMRKAKSGEIDILG